MLKRICMAIAFPRLWLLIILVPTSIVLLIYSMVFLGTDSAFSIGSYVIAFYALTVVCLRIPRMIAFFRSIKNGNKFLERWLSDHRFRMNASLYGTLIWNTAYALLQLGLGFYHSSFWFFSLFGYYISLAAMRFFLLRHTRRYSPGEKMREELVKYRAYGIVFLVMNITLSLMIFFMIYWQRTFVHHEITTITMAAYTFVSFTLAIINAVKYRKYNSPVYSASKAISLAAACVSMITLETTMLTTFGGDTVDTLTRTLFLALTGGAVSAVILTMAVYMIVRSVKEIKKIRYERRKNT